jgi:hypothetical protein
MIVPLLKPQQVVVIRWDIQINSGQKSASRNSVGIAKAVARLVASNGVVLTKKDESHQLVENAEIVLEFV